MRKLKNTNIVKYDYFTSDLESQKYGYFQIPYTLLDKKTYPDMTLEAAAVYGILLNRMGLSTNNVDRFSDEQGRLYIYYSVNELAELTNFSESKIKRILSLLENDAKLIYREKGSFRCNSRIYVKNYWREERSEDGFFCTKKDAEQHASIRVPFLLVKKNTFNSLDFKEKCLYGLLLDRLSLSKKNEEKFSDKDGHIYIIYTVNQIVDKLHISNKTIVKMLKNLEEFGLIKRKKTNSASLDIKSADHIYLMDYNKIRKLAYVNPYVKFKENQVKIRAFKCEKAEENGKKVYSPYIVYNVHINDNDILNVARGQIYTTYGVKFTPRKFQRLQPSENHENPAYAIKKKPLNIKRKRVNKLHNQYLVDNSHINSNDILNIARGQIYTTYELKSTPRMSSNLHSNTIELNTIKHISIESICQKILCRKTERQAKEDPVVVSAAVNKAVKENKTKEDVKDGPICLGKYENIELTSKQNDQLLKIFDKEMYEKLIEISSKKIFERSASAKPVSNCYKYLLTIANNENILTAEESKKKAISAEKAKAEALRAEEAFEAERKEQNKKAEDEFKILAIAQGKDPDKLSNSDYGKLLLAKYNK